VLVGLFLVLKYLGKEWINWLMSLWFGLAGLYSVPHVSPLTCLRGFLAIPYYPSLVSHSSGQIHVGHPALESICWILFKSHIKQHP
jgi:hypothetical protein